MRPLQDAQPPSLKPTRWGGLLSLPEAQRQRGPRALLPQLEVPPQEPGS
jgi:hypothetical protein